MYGKSWRRCRPTRCHAEGFPDLYGAIESRGVWRFADTGARETRDQRRADIGFAGDQQFAAMKLHQRFADWKPKPRSLVLARDPGVYLAERRERDLDFFRGHADAGVENR